MKNRNNLFLSSFLSGLKINFIGKLAFGDLIAFFISLTSINKWRLIYFKNNDLKKVHISLLLFLVFQLLSDLYNNTSFVNSARGLANAVMCIFVSMYLALIFIKSFRPLPYLFLGLSLSAIVFGNEIVNDAIASLEDMRFFKFRIVPCLNNLIFLLIIFISRLKFFKINNKHITLIFIFYGIFCFFFDARSNGMFFFISGLLIFNNRFISFLSFKNLPIVILILVLLQILYSYYIFSILNGELKSNQTKWQIEIIENPYNPFELLIAGRSEIIASSAAIKDKPLLGHGSWASDSKLIYTKLTINKLSAENQINAWADLYTKKNKDILIPTHSILFGAWVSAGIGGFLSLLYIYILIIKKSFQLFRNLKFIETIYFPITVYFFLSFIWIFLFSPLQELKMTVPFPIVFILIMNRKFQYN